MVANQQFNQEWHDALIANNALESIKLFIVEGAEPYAALAEQHGFPNLSGMPILERWKCATSMDDWIDAFIDPAASVFVYVANQEQQDEHGLNNVFTVLEWDNSTDDYVYTDDTPVLLLETDSFEDVAKLINTRLESAKDT